jgi:hypothetical protein
VAASAEEELEQLQHLNLGGLDSRDGVLDEVRTGAVRFVWEYFKYLLDPCTCPSLVLQSLQHHTAGHPPRTLQSAGVSVLHA